MIAKSFVNPQTKQCKIGCCSALFKNKKSCIVRRIVITQNQSTLYSWNSKEINQVLKQEIGETFATYYDELKNLDDTWKPISLQGEKSKALLFLPFLPKWEIQNDQRIFTGIWDVRNKQQYDLNEKFVQKIWPQIKLLDQRILGSLLANGSINATTPYFDFSLKNAQHVYWKYNFLKPFCNLAPKLCKREDKRTGKTYYGYKSQTRSVFKDYRQLFYPDEKKIIPSCVTDLLQSPEGLAEIYMDSGTYNKRNGNFLICTSGFQKEEWEFLQQKLQEFHGLESTIHKNGRHLRLYLPQKNQPILISKLKDHLLPMFYHQLGSVLDTGLKTYQTDVSFNRQDLREFQRKISIGDKQ